MANTSVCTRNISSIQKTAGQVNRKKQNLSALAFFFFLFQERTPSKISRSSLDGGTLRGVDKKKKNLAYPPSKICGPKQST